MFISKFISNLWQNDENLNYQSFPTVEINSTPEANTFNSNKELLIFEKFGNVKFVEKNGIKSPTNTACLREAINKHVELGNANEALLLAAKIKEESVKNLAFRSIAMAFAKQENVEAAIEATKGINNEFFKIKVLNLVAIELAKLENEHMALKAANAILKFNCENRYNRDDRDETLKLIATELAKQRKTDEAVEIVNLIEKETHYGDRERKKIERDDALKFIAINLLNLDDIEEVIYGITIAIKNKIVKDNFIEFLDLLNKISGKFIKIKKINSIFEDFKNLKIQFELIKNEFLIQEFLFNYSDINYEIPNNLLRLNQIFIKISYSFIQCAKFDKEILLDKEVLMINNKFRIFKQISDLEKTTLLKCTQLAATLSTHLPNVEHLVKKQQDDILLYSLKMRETVDELEKNALEARIEIEDIDIILNRIQTISKTELEVMDQNENQLNRLSLILNKFIINLKRIIHDLEESINNIEDDLIWQKLPQDLE